MIGDFFLYSYEADIVPYDGIPSLLIRRRKSSLPLRLFLLLTHPFPLTGRLRNERHRNQPRRLSRTPMAIRRIQRPAHHHHRLGHHRAANRDAAAQLSPTCGCGGGQAQVEAEEADGGGGECEGAAGE